MKITLPLSVMSGKEKFILNLNNYRNAHYQTLNKAKVNYKAAINVEGLEPVKGSVTLTYIYYHGDRRKVDISNPCSVIDKFACDALVEYGILPDDNCDIVKRVMYVYGGVDKDNPRCELKITEVA